MNDAYLAFPFHFDARGHTATADSDAHIRDLICQVLFTSPGERVNRPDFGCGVQQLVFTPNSDAIAAATQIVVQGALQRWLADLIEVERVSVSAQDEKLLVEVAYRRKGTGQRRTDVFAAPASAGGVP